MQVAVVELGVHAAPSFSAWLVAVVQVVAVEHATSLLAVVVLGQHVTSLLAVLVVVVLGQHVTSLLAVLVGMAVVEWQAEPDSEAAAAVNPLCKINEY